MAKTLTVIVEGQMPLLFHRLLHLWVFTIYDTGCICQHWTVRAVYTSTCYLLLSTKVFMCNLTPPLPYHLLSSKNSHGLSKLALAVFYGGYATAENPVKTCSTNFRGSVLMSYQIPCVAIFLLVWDSTTAANPKPNPIPTLVTLTITQQISLHF